MQDEKKIILERLKNYILEEPLDEYKNIIKNVEDTIWLLDKLNNNISFGTAGIRAPMGPGYNAMNIVVVYRFAIALSQLIKNENLNKKVVIGFDARHHSKDFAQEIFNVLKASKIKVSLFKEHCPTPILAFMVKECKASFGVMITASHNPKEDNGIKLFDELAGQATKDINKKIEDLMPCAPPRHLFYKDNKIDDRYGSYLSFDDAKNYFLSLELNKLFSLNSLNKNIKIIYTPLFGVGEKYFLKALSDRGFNNILIVLSQSKPDGDFPGLSCPNPEEEGVLNEAHILAKKEGADIVIANDPDADRVSISVKGDDDYIRLSGDQMGVILGYFIIKNSLEKKILNPLVISTIVSSRMLEAMAKKMNIFYADAKTGFSNIKNIALDLEKNKNMNFIFGYEEALGFLLKNSILDKDGIASALAFCEVAAFLKNKQMSFFDLLDELYLEFGLFVQESWSKRFDGLNKKDMKNFLNKLDAGIEGFSKKECLQNVLLFENIDGLRLLIRPSGTEPKIKFYLEAKKVIKNNEFLSSEKLKIKSKLLFWKNKIMQVV